jgi:aminomethyltransferase
MTAHGAIAEYWACREKAAIMDLTPLRKYEVTGPDAEALMQLCVTRNMKKLSVGQVVYTAMCYAHGGMIDDGTVFRLGENNFRWIGGNDDSGRWLRQQAEDNQLNAWVKNSTPHLANVAVQGPLSRDILKQIFWTAPTQPTIEELGWFRFAVARIGDYRGISCVVSRTGYSGELGYEVFCHPKDAEAVFDAIWAAGEPHGLTPLGLEALNLLRVEAGLIFAGYEFSDQTNPFEAGIGFTVPLKTQEDDFIGRAAIEERKAHPQRKLVGLDIESGTVPSSGDCIRVGKAQVGEITSSVKSPILGKVIALASLDTIYAETGTAVEVGQLDGHQKRLKAMVVRFPHFDPTKERVKGNYDV